jgi:hypothetical protein
MRVRLRFVAVLAAVLVPGSLGLMVRAPAAPAASAIPPGGCGDVLLAGASWLGGGGVDVHSNGTNEGSGASCSTTISRVNNVVAGSEWQCVELVNRLYLKRGWIHSTWSGDGDQMYDTAPGNLTKQPNGSVSSVSPGDVVSIQEFLNGARQDGGHVMVVNSSGTVTSGTVPLVGQNGGSPTNATTTRNAILSGGKLTIAGGAGWSYTVVGVVHAPPARRGVAVARNPDGRLEVFATASDGVVFHDWQKSPNGATGWSGWGQLASTPGFTSVAVGTNKNGQLEAFATASNGVVFHDWHSASGWSGWGQL